MARRAASRSRARMRHAHTHTRARATSGRRAALPRGARRIIITHRIQARLSSRDDECSHFAFSTLRPARCLLPLTSARTALSDARILMMADEVQPSAFAAMGGFHSAALRTSRRAAMPLGKLWMRPARVRTTSGQRRAAVHVGRELSRQEATPAGRARRRARETRAATYSACLGPRRCLALGRIALSCGGTTYGSSSPSAPSDTSPLERHVLVALLRALLLVHARVARVGQPRAGNAGRASRQLRLHARPRVNACAGTRASGSPADRPGAHTSKASARTSVGRVSTLHSAISVSSGWSTCSPVARAIPPLPPALPPLPPPPCARAGARLAAGARDGRVPRAALAATVVPAVAVAEAASVAPRLAHMAAACAHMPPSPSLHPRVARVARRRRSRAAPACPRARGADRAGLSSLYCKPYSTPKPKHPLLGLHPCELALARSAGPQKAPSQARARARAPGEIARARAAAESAPPNHANHARGAAPRRNPRQKAGRALAAMGGAKNARRRNARRSAGPRVGARAPRGRWSARAALGNPGMRGPYERF
eukprot:PRCOL_00001820-RA